MNDPVSIQTISSNKTAENTQQLYYEVQESDKVNALCRLFDKFLNYILLYFVKQNVM